MVISFDPRKEAINIAKHGVSLSRAKDFDFDSAAIRVDNRKDYGEVRYRGIGFLKVNLFVLVFCETPEGIRAISLRKAEKSEEREYAEEF